MNITTTGTACGTSTTESTEVERLRRENDVLRALLPALQAPCAYCGLTNMARCPHGFPGCPQADDILCGEETAAHSVLERLHRLEGHEKKVPAQPDIPYVVDGIEVSISSAARLAIRINDRVLLEWFSNGDETPPYGINVSVGNTLLFTVSPRWATRGAAVAWAEKLVNRIRD